MGVGEPPPVVDAAAASASSCWRGDGEVPSTWKPTTLTGGLALSTGFLDAISER